MAAHCHKTNIIHSLSRAMTHTHWIKDVLELYIFMAAQYYRTVPLGCGLANKWQVVQIGMLHLTLVWWVVTHTPLTTRCTRVVSMETISLLSTPTVYSMSVITETRVSYHGTTLPILFHILSPQTIFTTAPRGQRTWCQYVATISAL